MDAQIISVHIPLPFLPSFSGNELSREIPRASLAARMVTSRHVTRTHSMKAVNACKLNMQ